MRNPNFELEKFWTPLHKILDPPPLRERGGICDHHPANSQNRTSC